MKKWISVLVSLCLMIACASTTWAFSTRFNDKIMINKVSSLSFGGGGYLSLTC